LPGLTPYPIVPYSYRIVQIQLHTYRDIQVHNKHADLHAVYGLSIVMVIANNQLVTIYSYLTTQFIID